MPAVTLKLQEFTQTKQRSAERVTPSQSGERVRPFVAGLLLAWLRTSEGLRIWWEAFCAVAGFAELWRLSLSQYRADWA